MKSIYHQLRIAATPETVFNAITTQKGLAGWWTPETTATPTAGTIARFAFGGYFKEMEITTIQPPNKVEWRCITGYQDWVGTTLTFELTQIQGGTNLLFHHDGFREYNAGFAACSYDWAVFLRSLRLLCETGKGTPYPNHHSLNR